MNLKLDRLYIFSFFVEMTTPRCCWRKPGYFCKLLVFSLVHHRKRIKKLKSKSPLINSWQVIQVLLRHKLFNLTDTSILRLFGFNRFTYFRFQKIASVVLIFSDEHEKKNSYLIRQRLKIYTNFGNLLDTLKRNGTRFNVIFQQFLLCKLYFD